MKTRSKIMKFFPLALAVVFVFLAADLGRNLFMLAINGVETTATVVDIVRQVRTSTTYVEYTANGVVQTETAGFLLGGRREIGETFTVFYNPQNPSFTAQNPIRDLLIFALAMIAVVTLCIWLAFKKE